VEIAGSHKQSSAIVLFLFFNLLLLTSAIQVQARGATLKNMLFCHQAVEEARSELFSQQSQVCQRCHGIAQKKSWIVHNLFFLLREKESYCAQLPFFFCDRVSKQSQF